MDINRYRDEIEAVVPGVLDAYERLKTKNGMGIYTSNGAFYNHTFFGRDNAMAAKFVADFDHEVTREVIVALAAMQGTKKNDTTQEDIGRIHHEYRDLRTWRGGSVERMVMRFFLKKWGGSDKQLLTYYAHDTTALYIRLVNKYVTHIDKSFLDHVVINQNEDRYTIRESVARAANWLCLQVDENGRMVPKRTNDWALPYQTFQDSSTAFVRTDGHLANYRRGISFTEVQAFSADALHDTLRLVPGHHSRVEWQDTVARMQTNLFETFWSDELGYFCSAIDTNGPVDMPTVTAGWTLNTSLWDTVDDAKYEKLLRAVVGRLFSDDFLTPVGLRTRALNSPQPLLGVVEYHGRLTVWPMFTFMVIEGLRRHRLHRLAEQLENRVINGINASGSFEEFFVIDGGGHMLKSVPGAHAEVSVDAQMLPEKHIAFTIIPSLVLAYRASNAKHVWPTTNSEWRKKLEDDILASIDIVERVPPAEAKEVVSAVVPTKFRRVRGNIRTLGYFLKERRAM